MFLRSIHRRMEKQMWYIHSASTLLFSNKKEQTTSMHHNVHASHRQAKWKKPYMRVAWFHSEEVLELAKTNVGEWKLGVDREGTWESFWSDGCLLNLSRGLSYTSVYIYPNSPNVEFTFACFVVSKFYLKRNKYISKYVYVEVFREMYVVYWYCSLL